MGIFTVFNAKNFTPSYYPLLKLVIVWYDTVYIALLLTLQPAP